MLISPATLRDGMWRKFLATSSSLSNEVVRGPSRGRTACSIPVSTQWSWWMRPTTYGIRQPFVLMPCVAPRRLTAKGPGTPHRDAGEQQPLGPLTLLAYFIKNDAAFADIGIRRCGTISPTPWR